ncbi:phosphotransferase family protein [Saccharopolyspora flava]|uniref:Predicted kinase, aminoglycoside phosphotransferase (APT) family n=1 Tax=Saccharopolyspora flava TaxID=95161 RepID=A0A1I6RMX5_9PSEU|nr:phosphotransferase family protein [Saccharopolyspora flava]SFS66055.1 Predicted kinase, aminoglycoside phosphotransferase (APT) family [Saccharopolyspora flava]
MELQGIEREAVTRWLDRHGVPAPVEFSLVSGGRSNLTYRVTGADGRVRALRRPPTGGVLSTAHDMSREWRFISALHGTGVPVPTPIAYCDDPEITGATFYVMDFVDGHVLADRDSAGPFSREARHRAGIATVECMAALHNLDPDAVGLGDAARRDGYLQRQLSRWQKQVHASGAPDLALLDAVHDALAANVPPQTTGIVHGDFRPGNLSYGLDGEVLAVFDWELATLGEPLADLGWLIATWEEPGDDLPAVTPGPTAEGGFPTRDDLITRYRSLTGRDLADLPFYVAFQRWRSCCITAGVRARYQAGHMADDGYDATERADTEQRQAHLAWKAVKDLGLV